MKKILAIALVGILTSSAQAIELKLVAGDDSDADKHITLALSETGLVSIYMTMFERDGTWSGAALLVACASLLRLRV